MESLQNLSAESGGRSLGTEQPSTTVRPGETAEFERRLESVREERSASEARANDRRGAAASQARRDRATSAKDRPEDSGEPEEPLDPEQNEDRALLAAPQVPTEARPLPPGSGRPTKAEGRALPGTEPTATAGPEGPPTELSGAAVPGEPAPQVAAPQEPAPIAQKAAGEATVTVQRLDAAGETTVQLERDLAPARGPVDASERAQRQLAAEVLGQVRVAIKPGMRQAEIHLTPAELGRVSIRLAIRGARVDAVARVESIEAMAALERHLPELRAAFADRGLEVGELSLEYSGDSPSDPERDAPSRRPAQLRSSAAATEPTAERPRSRPDVTTDDAVDTLA